MVEFCSWRKVSPFPWGSCWKQDHKDASKKSLDVFEWGTTGAYPNVFCVALSRHNLVCKNIQFQIECLTFSWIINIFTRGELCALVYSSHLESSSRLRYPPFETAQGSGECAGIMQAAGLAYIWGMSGPRGDTCRQSDVDKQIAWENILILGEIFWIQNWACPAGLFQTHWHCAVCAFLTWHRGKARGHTEAGVRVDFEITCNKEQRREAAGQAFGLARCLPPGVVRPRFPDCQLFMLWGAGLGWCFFHWAFFFHGCRCRFICFKRGPWEVIHIFSTKKSVQNS